MRLLLIDTVGQPNLVAFSDTREAEVRDLLWNANGDEAERILPAIQEVLGSTERADGVLCVNGPGRFSSTRIGVAVANALSGAWGVPCMGISRIDFSRELLSEDGVGRTIAVRSEKGGCYVASDGGAIMVVEMSEDPPPEAMLIEEPAFRELWSKRKMHFFQHMEERIVALSSDGIILPTYARLPNITAMKRL